MSLLFNSFQAYIKSLAEKHVDVLHDDASKTGFIKMQSDDEVLSLAVDASPNIVICSNFIGRAIGTADEKKLRQNASLSFLCYAETGTGNPTAEIEAAQKKALEIMFDFYSRIQYDREQNDCGPLQYARTELMTFRPEIQMLDRHFGWEMTIPFDAYAPGFNSLKWTDTNDPD